MPYKDKVKAKEYADEYLKKNGESINLKQRVGRKEDPERFRAYSNKCYAKNKAKRKEYKRKRDLKYPWLISYMCAKDRCNNVNSVSYARYGGRGIKFLLTREEIKKLWFREKASSLKQPSIDKINNDGNYEYSNCQFIEFLENTRKGTK